MTDKTKKIKRPPCENCGSGMVYVTLKGDVICRRCGYREYAKEPEKKEEVKN